MQHVRPGLPREPGGDSQRNRPMQIVILCPQAARQIEICRREQRYEPRKDEQPRTGPHAPLQDQTGPGVFENRRHGIQNWLRTQPTTLQLASTSVCVRTCASLTRVRPERTTIKAVPTL